MRDVYHMADTRQDGPGATMLKPLLISGAIALLLCIGGGLLTEIGPWYRDLRKPRLNPPNWLFGPAWTVILGLAAWSASVAWKAAPDATTRGHVVLVYGLNALFHLLWSPLFFKAKRPDWALGEVMFLWASLVAIIVVVAPFAPFAAKLVLPYLLWVTFATWLNRQIVVLNRPFG